MIALEKRESEIVAAPTRTRRVAMLFVVPCAFYFVAWCVLSWPLIGRFWTHFYSDAQDGMVFAWILWWYDKAIAHLHQSPFFTTYLHYPYGAPLLSHAPMLFNSL